MSSENSQNIFTPKNINPIAIIIISEGIQKRNQGLYGKRYLERRRRRVGVYLNIQKLSLSHKLKPFGRIAQYWSKESLLPSFQ